MVNLRVNVPLQRSADFLNMEFRRSALLASLLLIQIAKETLAQTSQLVVYKGNNYDAVHGMWCPIWKNQVCGTDGITYWNQCMFQAAASARSGLDVQKPGACEDLDCDECDPNDEKIEICGSNAQIFTNRCQFECHTDTYPLLLEVYDHCRRGFPTRDELMNATTDLYIDVFNAYHLKYLDIIKLYGFENMVAKKHTFNAEVYDAEVKVMCRKIAVNDFSTVKKIDKIFFYSYNDVYGYTKFVFSLESLEMEIKKYRVSGLGRRKLKGSAKISIGVNKFELTAEASSCPEEDFCPIVKARSLRLVDLDDITVVLRPEPKSTTSAELEGLFKDKVMDVINDLLAPQIVNKLAEIPCLRSSNQPVKCFGFFQARMCF